MQVSSKIGVIESLIEKVDKIILGGGMIFTFFKARGMGVGSSLVEEDNLDLAKRLEKLAKDKGTSTLYPITVCENNFLLITWYTAHPKILYTRRVDSGLESICF